ncbi:MAG: hypothetical protein ACON4H_18270 [Rubripirellula sp.]
MAKQRSLELLAACDLHAVWVAIACDGRPENFAKLRASPVLLARIWLKSLRASVRGKQKPDNTDHTDFSNEPPAKHGIRIGRRDLYLFRSIDLVGTVMQGGWFLK